MTGLRGAVSEDPTQRKRLTPFRETNRRPTSASKDEEPEQVVSVQSAARFANVQMQTGRDLNAGPIYAFGKDSRRVRGSHFSLTFSLGLFLGIRWWRRGGKGTGLGPLSRLPPRAWVSSRPAFAAGETAQGENEKLRGVSGEVEGRAGQPSLPRPPPPSQRHGGALKARTTVISWWQGGSSIPHGGV